MSGQQRREVLSKTKLEFYKQIKLYQKTLKPTKEIEGIGSAPIVGEKNYPQLKIHNVSTEDKNNSFFKSSNIVKQDYKDIFKTKAKNILGSTQESHIKKTTQRINEEIVNIYKSKTEIEFNSKFENELKFNKILTNKVSGIMGTKNELQSLEATQNTTTSKQIEKYSEGDTKAKEAIIRLYEKGTNEHQIIHLLALGVFGIQINKKLVPSRWAITAYDQTIEKYLHKKIIKYNAINKFEVYYYKNKSDTHINILLPDTYHGEHFEDWEGITKPDYFNNDNKLSTSEPNNAGGYFATKIALNEFLDKRKKQSAAIMIRVIRKYDVPLGVVFVRECVRESFKNKVFETNNFKELQEYIKEKFPVHYPHLMNSKVLKEQKRQTKLNKFF